MEKASAREGMDVADGCSFFRKEDKQMVFTDLTLLMATLLGAASGQCREGWAGLQVVQLFWEGLKRVSGQHQPRIHPIRFGEQKVSGSSLFL